MNIVKFNKNFKFKLHIFKVKYFINVNIEYKNKKVNKSALCYHVGQRICCFLIALKMMV